MKAASPPLLPLLRSRVQGGLLALLYLHPEGSYSLTELARHVGSSVPGVHAEVTRLIDAGYVTDERVGNVRRIRAATNTPVYRPLTDLLAVTFGPRPVLADLLDGVAGVQEAYIYGSWARRYAGRPGSGMPNDIDVLVVGDADLDTLDELARDAEAKLRRPVNITRLSRADWEAPEAQPFVRTVRDGDLIPIAGTPSVKTERRGA
jgi:predicted nucleotidyltransferase